MSSIEPPRERSTASIALLSELRRNPQEGKLSGLSAALGQRWDVDPLLIRATFFVLALGGGVGLVLYLAGWAMTSEVTKNTAPLDNVLPGWRKWSATTIKWLVVGSCLVAALALSPALPFGLTPSAIILLAWWLATRSKKNSVTQPTPQRWTPGVGYRPTPAAIQTAEAMEPTLTQPWPQTMQALPPQPPSPVHQPTRLYDTRFQAPNYYWAPPTPPPSYPPMASEPQPAPLAAPVRPRRRRRWMLPLFTTLLSLAVMIGATFLPMPLTQRTTLGFAAGLMVVAVGLLVGTKVGKSVWLIVWGLILSVGLAGPAATASLPEWSDLQPVYTWTQASDLPTENMQLNLKDVTIDLTDYTSDENAHLTIEANASNVKIKLPRETNAAVHLELNGAAATLPDSSTMAGVMQETWGTSMDTDLPLFVINLTANGSNVEVTR